VTSLLIFDRAASLDENEQLL